MHICLLRDTGAMTGTQPEARDSGTGWTGNRDTELMDIWASRALGGTSASRGQRCWGLAETEGLVERPDSGWLSSSSSSLSSFSSSSGPSESSPSESWRSALLTWLRSPADGRTGTYSENAVERVSHGQLLAAEQPQLQRSSNAGEESHDGCSPALLHAAVVGRRAPLSAIEGSGGKTNMLLEAGNAFRQLLARALSLFFF